MRIEVPNRTEDLDRRLQNSTNNLINRSEHRSHFMLAWHTTGANATIRVNEVRTMVMQRVAAAQPPLPFNSTRGLTPGLINPLLGNIPGNSIPHPVLGGNQGRLRVGMTRQQQHPLANIAPVNLPQPNQPQVPVTQQVQGSNDQRRGSRKHGRKVTQKRHASRGLKGRSPKRRAADVNSSADDEMDTNSDGSGTSKVCMSL